MTRIATFIVALLLSAPLLAEPIAVFVSVQEGEGTPKFWWSEELPTLSPFDHALIETENKRGLQVVFPKALDVSRIFRTAALTATNARTLASNFSVDRGVVGSLVTQAVESVAGMSGVEGTLQVTDLHTGEQWSFVRVAYDDQQERAAKKLYRELSTTLTIALSYSSRRARADVGLETTANDRIVAVSGATFLTLLAELRAKKSATQIVWASGGRVALRFETDPDRTLRSLKTVSVTKTDDASTQYRIE